MIGIIGRFATTRLGGIAARGCARVLHVNVGDVEVTIDWGASVQPALYLSLALCDML